MTKLQYYRVEKGLSKRELARRAGISDNVIRRIEKKEAYSNITIGSFKKLADALNIDLFELIEEDLIEEDLLGKNLPEENLLVQPQ